MNSDTEKHTGDKSKHPARPPAPSLEDVDAHRRLVLWLFVDSFLICGSLLGSVLWSLRANKEIATIFLVVIAAGALGGFVSSLRRLYGFKNVFPVSDYGHLFRGGNIYVVVYSFVPGLVGAIGAAVVYVALAGGLIEGSLFPKFRCTTVNCDDFLNFVNNWSPESAQDYAKAIIWGFVAGFSERFVPDVLDKLGSKTHD